jgi:hypothetical protein
MTMRRDITERVSDVCRILAAMIMIAALFYLTWYLRR